MNLHERIEKMFPAESEVPLEFRIDEPIICDKYLVNGELRRWDGPFRDVLAAVPVKTANSPEPKLLGRYPLMTEKESMEALEAAVKAYDHGRGLWPTMSVRQRIKYVEDFCFRM